MNSSKKTVEIILIIGLPGSGKTEYAKSIMNCFWHDPTVVFIDDIEYPKSTMIGNLDDTTEMIITTFPGILGEEDTDACKNFLSTALWKLGFNREFNLHIFGFENNPEACLHNARLRPDKIVTGFIKLASRKYVVPSSCIPIPVIKYSKPKENDHVR